jgi:type VI protein secretion system component Hcp
MSNSIYLLLPGIPGDSRAQQFEGQIELISAAFSGSTTVITQGGGAGSAVGKVNLSPMSVTKKYDSASQPLFLKMCSGVLLPTAKISFVLDGVGPYVTIDLTSVRVGSLMTDTSDGVLTDSVSLYYQTIQISYRSQLADGSLSQPAITGWDLSKNAPITPPPPPAFTTVTNKVPIKLIRP